MLDARFSPLYFCQSLNRLQRGPSAIAELLVHHSVTSLVGLMNLNMTASGNVFTYGQIPIMHLSFSLTICSCCW